MRWTSYFSFMSAAGHFAILHFWDYYTKGLAKGQNRIRWFEYMWSHSLIMTLLFMLWGNFDWIQLAGCYMVCALTIMFGDLHEI